MKLLKRTLIIALCVSILSVSVGSKWFDSNHMEKVNATEAVTAVALSAAAMYAICYYVGTLAYMTAPIETAEIPDRQIAYTGYCTLRKAYIGASNPALANSPVLTFIDKAGQPYVYGSEALQEVAETEFKVILGGKMPGDDDNDDDNNEEEIDTTTDDKSGIVDNVVHMYGNVKELGAAVSIGFATMITKLFGDEYDKYINGEESIYTPTIEYTPVTDSDIEEQWSGHGYTFNFTGTNSLSHGSHTGTAIYEHTRDLFSPCAGYIVNEDSYGYKSFSFFCNDGNFSYPTKITCSCGYTRTDVGNWNLRTKTYSCNVPIFNSPESAKNYITTKQGLENALNYEKNYRIGDWLQDDWSGELLDPYTGLHALGDMYNIARHQGLNALGNEIDFSQFTDFIRDYFGNLDNANLPEVDPSLNPINYPVSDNFPEYSFNPENNPALQPVTDPGTAPGTGIVPDNPDKDTPDDPSGGGSSGGGSSESGPFVADLSKFFPFCIPFDLIHLLSVLEAEPETPRWEIPFKIPAYGVDETIVIDLSAFDGVAKIVRLCETILFIFSLILATRGLIKG